MIESSADILAALDRQVVRLPVWLRKLGGGFLVYFVAYLLVDTHAVRHIVWITPPLNPNVAEADAILHGRLDLESRAHDTALYRGKVYNAFPPMFTGVALTALALTPAGVPPLVLLVLVIPLPGLAYVLFLRRSGSVTVAVIFGICYVVGTSLLPVVNRALLWGEVWYVNHVLSQWGLLLFLLDWFGRQRLWPAAIGLAIAFWSRQLTLFYAAPLFLAAFRDAGAAARWRRLALVGVGTAVMLAVPLTLNLLKFGSPLETGYRYLYAGRTDTAAMDAQQHGVFAVRYVPRNLYYTNFGFPEVVTAGGWIRLKPDSTATGIWWTTPLLLYVLRERRRLWADPATRRLLLASGAVFAAILLYHTAGGHQTGMNRFSLDYVVVWLAMVSAFFDTARRKKTAAVLTAWSVWYFRWAI